MNQPKLGPRPEPEPELGLDSGLETTPPLIDIHTNTEADMDTSFESASTTPTSKAVKNTYRASAIEKNTFVFRRLEKTAIKDCEKENVVPISPTLAPKH